MADCIHTTSAFFVIILVLFSFDCKTAEAGGVMATGFPCDGRNWLNLCQATCQDSPTFASVCSFNTTSERMAKDVFQLVNTDLRRRRRRRTIFDSLWGGSKFPWGNSKYPWGNSENPWGKSRYPWGDTENPWGTAKYPWGDSAHPWGNSAHPWGNSKYPWGNTKNPWGNTKNPWGNTEHPWGNSTYPWGDQRLSSDQKHLVFFYNGNYFGRVLLNLPDADGSQQKNPALNDAAGFCYCTIITPNNRAIVISNGVIVT